MTKRTLPVVTADKTMMPEVLPDPRAARRTTASPRRRTLERLQTLLAASAAAATLSCGGNGPGGSGYAVVDPMPMPPPRCFDPNSKLRVDARFVRAPTGALVLRVRIELLPDVTDVRIGAVLFPEPDHVLAQSLDPSRGGTIDLPTTSEISARVVVDVSCSEQTYPGDLEIYASWDPNPTEATKVTLSTSAAGNPYRQPPLKVEKPVTPDDPRYAKPPPPR